jgi:RNA polymerase sigma-70 factor, ECF subfamily
MLARAHPVTEPDQPIATLIGEGSYRRAVELCAESYAAALGRLCMALLGSQADAEEVVQETLLAAHAAMASYRGEGTVRAWLFGIARRQCARHLERGKQSRRHLQLVSDPASPDDGPEVSVSVRRRADRVRAALAQLRPSEREALLLRYQSGLSFREIASACGIDEAAARKRASRGLERMRRTLSPEGME